MRTLPAGSRVLMNEAHTTTTGFLTADRHLDLAVGESSKTKLCALLVAWCLLLGLMGCLPLRKRRGNVRLRSAKCFARRMLSALGFFVISLPALVYGRCLPPLPNNKNYTWLGQGFSIHLEENDWLGAAVSTRTAALLLEEVLGFDVHVHSFPMVWGNASDDPLSRLQNGFVDANLEAWATDWPSERVDDYTVVRNTVTKQAYTDFKGRVGIYVSHAVVEANPTLYMDYWRPYQSREVKDFFVFENATLCACSKLQLIPASRTNTVRISVAVSKKSSLRGHPIAALLTGVRAQDDGSLSIASFLARIVHRSFT